MAYSTVQVKECDLLEHSSVETNRQQLLLLTIDSAIDHAEELPVEALPIKTLPVGAYAGEELSADFSLQCLLKAIKIDGQAGLLARTSYRFTQAAPNSLPHAFQHADTLNQQLAHSRVFVVQDVDGDQSYYLRMDTVLSGAYERQNISLFLSRVNQDVGILVDYFR